MLRITSPPKLSLPANARLRDFPAAQLLPPPLRRPYLALVSGDLSGAEEQFSKVVETVPGYSAAYLGLGMIRLRQGDVEKAIELTNKAVLTNPRNADATHTLGNIKFDQGKMEETPDPPMTAAASPKPLDALLHECRKVIVGQPLLLNRLLVALLVPGHVLLEGLPGLAKTRTIKTLAAASHLGFRRIQFTPDLLPSDVVGTLVFDPRTLTFSPKKGPIFANLLRSTAAISCESASRSSSA